MMVVDASVATKWLLPEQGSAEARALLDTGKRLVAPSIVRTEVAGAVLRHFREGKISEAAATDACELWSSILDARLLHLMSFEELFDLAVALSFECRHALVDCLYVAAGKQLGFSVITADEPLFKRCSKVHSRIEWLGGIGPH